ncbi:MAG: hypothetical protein WKF90_01305 [Pyrinomonadaceae bacterium]
MLEPNGVQSCPIKTKATVLSSKARSSRAHARRIEGWLERIEEILRLLERVKSPSKSSSTFPVKVVFGAGSSHSKFEQCLQAVRAVR